ncbi:MAG TPA: ATP-binding protein [Burkholderiales bacterium]|jgi:light-regulated signal transduction histidine kinase (bacteriophytochrome)|nr:ATP-binding protein [Burkholderiales bacterium]
MACANNLFTPFQRLHSTRELEWTGIGLTTVQRIVSRHGGSILAETVEDQGATFFFTLEDGA